MSKLLSQSGKDTFAFGQGLASSFCGGEKLALFGDLGAGKTVLAKGIADGLGIKTKVISPTFNIMKVYPVRGHKSIKQFCHIDAYRLHSAKDLELIGFEDYCNKSTVILIEWADKVSEIINKNYQQIKIKHLENDSREISF